MAKFWIIHREDGTTLGPWQAAEVREALRAGQIEPFDRVQAEGSPTLCELLEVDEIFQTSGDSTALAEEARTLLLAAPPPPEERSTRLSTAPALRTQAMPENPGGARFLGLADPSVAEQSAFNRSASEPTPEQRKRTSQERPGAERKFYLIDEQGKKSGPFTAVDVQALYHKHQLSERIKVRKKGARGEINLRQFMETYEKLPAKNEPKLKRASSPPPLLKTVRARAPWLLPSPLAPPGPLSMGAEQLRHRQFLILLAVGATLLATLLLLFSTPSPRSRRAAEDGTRPPRGASNLRAGPLAVPPGRSIEESSPAQATAPQGKLNIIDARNLQKQSAPPSAPASRRERHRHPPRPRLPASTIERRPVRRPNSSSVPARPLASATEPAPSRPPLQTAEAGGTITQLAEALGWDGQVVTVGPLSFSEAALAACQNKCSIPMRDSGGRVLLVKFFKAAYISRLNGKESGVFISGRLSEGGTSMYLSRVL